MRRIVGSIVVVLAALTASCARPVAAKSPAPASAFVTVAPVPVSASPGADDLPAEPTPDWIPPLPLSAGPDEPTTPGMRLSYSLRSDGFADSNEVWVVTSVQSGADGTRVVVQEQVGRTPGLNHVVEILPNEALEFESFDIGFRSGAQLTRKSGAVDVPAPTVLTTTPSTFAATYTEAGQPTQLTVSAQVRRLGAQRIVVPAGTYDADVVQEDVSYDVDGSHNQIGYVLDLVPGIGIVDEIEQWSTNGGQPRYVGTLALTSVAGGASA